MRTPPTSFHSHVLPLRSGVFSSRLGSSRELATDHTRTALPCPALCTAAVVYRELNLYLLNLICETEGGSSSSSSGIGGSSGNGGGSSAAEASAASASSLGGGVGMGE